MIGYQTEWYGYDNKNFFENVPSIYKKFEWKILPAYVFGNKLFYPIGQRI
jgi:hypothetical protein